MPQFDVVVARVRRATRMLLPAVRDNVTGRLSRWGRLAAAMARDLRPRMPAPRPASTPQSGPGQTGGGGGRRWYSAGIAFRRWYSAGIAFRRWYSAGIATRRWHLAGVATRLVSIVRRRRPAVRAPASAPVVSAREIDQRLAIAVREIRHIMDDDYSVR